MVKADLDHPALEKVPFYEARLIHRKNIHMASVHSAGQLNILASRNRDSGAVETYIPDTETAFDWLNYHS